MNAANSAAAAVSETATRTRVPTSAPRAGANTE